MDCQVLPAIGAASILELVAKGGSSRKSQARNVHLALQLLTITIDKKNSMRIFKHGTQYLDSLQRVHLNFNGSSKMFGETGSLCML